VLAGTGLSSDGREVDAAGLVVWVELSRDGAGSSHRAEMNKYNGKMTCTCALIHVCRYMYPCMWHMHVQSGMFLQKEEGITDVNITMCEGTPHELRGIA